MADKGGKIRFAEELFKRETQPLLDLTILQCYKNAYPNQVKTSTTKSLSELASRLMKDVKVISRLEELRQVIDDKLIYSAEQSFNKLKEIQKISLECPIGVKSRDFKRELPAALKAEELCGKLTGLYIAKTDITTNGESISFTQEMFDKRIKELSK